MNSIVVIDKASGMTSHDVCDEVRKITSAKKAGHTGTLDPLATGVLPVCLDEATKLVPFLSQDDKDYRAVMLLGVETDTFDIEGRVTERCELSVTGEEITDVARSFVGPISQVPPRYSAIKHRGKSLHRWARNGFLIDPLPREVYIEAIRVEEVSFPYVTIFISCSKGTYVRSLCADIGRKLRCGACLAGLRRTRSGSFDEGRALSLESLRSGGQVGIVSMVDAIALVPSIDIDAELAARLRKGFQPAVGVLREYLIPFLAMADVVKFTFAGRHLVAVGKMLCSSEDLRHRGGDEQAVRVMRVFND